MHAPALLSLAAVLAAPLALTLAARAPAPPQDPSAAPPIRGVAIDEAGAPLAGVRYWISGFEERDGDAWHLVGRTGLPRPRFTGDDGAFELAGEPGVRYDVDFDAPGRTPVFLRRAEPGSMHAVTLRRGATVAGVVVQRSGGEEAPVALATVTLQRSSARGLWYEHTILADAEGRFELRGKLPPRADDETWFVSFGGARLALDPDREAALDDLRIAVEIGRGPR